MVTIPEMKRSGYLYSASGASDNARRRSAALPPSLAPMKFAGGHALKQATPAPYSGASMRELMLADVSKGEFHG
jgi:hypothetical protein